MIRARLTHWLYAPPATGGLALACALLLTAAPTVIRWAASGAVTGCEFTPYLPFVLVAALLLPWWLAGAVALASVAILGGLFFHPLHNAACFSSAAGIFLASSAIMIGGIALIREAVRAIHGRGADDCGGIVFSVDKGQVWATWYGQGAPVLLGSRSKVAATMRGFLDQAGACTNGAADGDRPPPD